MGSGTRGEVRCPDEDDEQRLLVASLLVPLLLVALSRGPKSHKSSIFGEVDDLREVPCHQDLPAALRQRSIG
jgi:hypothetical protein